MSDANNQGANIGKVPNGAESLRNLRDISERKENHTLTVREVARLFEAAGVARTERSIINWCQPNKVGVPRLDAFLDPNEQRYYITPESVNLAIAEEQDKVARLKGPEHNPTDVPAASGVVPKPSEGKIQPQTTSVPGVVSEDDSKRIRELEAELKDQTIANRVKDKYIEQLEKDRDGFASERTGFINKLIGFSRTLGQMETRLLQLGAPKEEVDAITATESSLLNNPDSGIEA